MIKNIVFDLGNVLTKWDPEVVYDKYFVSSDDKEEFYTKTQIKTQYIF
jgi:FMN phosphatase YigB (HAD superfamily)